MKREPVNFEYFTKCPICSSSALSPFKKGTFNFLNLNKDQIKITDSDYGKTWDLSRCMYCTHIFANPCPSPNFIHSLYSKIEDPLYQEEARGRSKNFLRIISFLEKIHPTKGVLFDVGAATGILLSIALRRGWKPEGIEASAWAVRIAQEKYNLKIHEGYFEKADLPQNYYTAVTMVDFIEHVPNPFEAVAKANEILAPEGTLCIVTPDVNSLAAKITRGKWWHFRPAHLGYFSSKSLAILLQRAGFRIVKLRKYSWTFSARYLISRKPWLNFLLKNPHLASFWEKISIKLALCDSFEIYARKESRK